MFKARDGHGNAYGVFISPEGWWTLAGGNTPGNDSETLRPEGSPESTAGYRPIRPISPIRPILLPHPQTHPHPKSTLAHPKSTVDLGCEGLIRGKNGLRSPLSPTSYRPKSGPKIKGSNQNQTVTNQKIYSASPLFLPRPTKSFRPKLAPFFTILFYPIPPFANLFYPFCPPHFLPGTIKDPYSS